jgi:hypothetical protein
LESGVVTLIHSAAADAAERAANAWRAHPAGSALLKPGLAEATPGIEDRADRTMRDWQRAVLELVRDESSKKLYFAKVSAYAVNGLGLCLMIAVFAATAFIPTGAEIAVAGGTTIAAQKVLEAIFGDDAVRRLAEKARQDLLSRVAVLLGQEAQRFHVVLADTAVDPEAAATAPRRRVARSTGSGAPDERGGTGRRVGQVCPSVARVCAPKSELAAARALVERAGERLALSRTHTVVALAGSTGSGKSSIFNALAGGRRLAHRRAAAHHRRNPRLRVGTRPRGRAPRLARRDAARRPPGRAGRRRPCPA